MHGSSVYEIRYMRRLGYEVVREEREKKRREEERREEEKRRGEERVGMRWNRRDSESRVIQLTVQY